jgi:long-chain fatty acid transport protein
MMGVPATFGFGLMASAGAGVNFRHIPNSNGTSVMMSILGIAPSLAVDLTDRFSVGANLILGSATLDAPFQGISAATLAYALRGTVGFNADVGCDTSLGFYYQTSQNFNFDNAIRLQLPVGFSPVLDLNAGLPANYGLGIANERLMDGRLLLAADVLFKDWNSAYLFGDLYKNQWVFQLGAQYKMNRRIRLRLGYAYATNPIDQTLGNSAGGILPPVQAQAALQYVQATVAVVNPHRISCGVGIRDVLPGVDLDFLAGGMFRAEQDFGPFTSASVQGYWVGAGFTWRFGRGACQRLPSADECGECK